MKKVESKDLVVGRQYYAHDDSSTPLTFVKYDESGDPCFNQGGIKRYSEANGLVCFFKSLIFTEAKPELKATDLTLQEKFEQGWSIVHNDGTNVVEMHAFDSGRVAVVWDDKRSSVFRTEQDFINGHTITPPAPKVEKMFTVVYVSIGTWVVVDTGIDYQSIEDAKSNMDANATCILEHEKQGDKWIFVKAHNI